MGFGTKQFEKIIIELFFCLQYYFPLIRRIQRFIVDDDDVHRKTYQSPTEWKRARGRQREREEADFKRQNDDD